MTKLILFFSLLIPVLNINAQCWKMIAPGGLYHTLAIKNDGTLWASGGNNAGQLGDSSFETRTVFTQIGVDNDWQSVSATGYRSYAIKTNGTLWSWGQNYTQQLGLNSTQLYYLKPEKVGTDQDWLSLSVQLSYDNDIRTFVLKADHTLWALNNVPAQIVADTNWSIIATGEEHTLAIKTDGTLWAWGLNNFGQLGNGTNTDVLVPAQIDTATNWKAVAPGYYHSLALKTDGTLWATGWNHWGELGDGTQIARNIFTRIDNNTNWKAVAAGDYHSSAIKNDGTLWVWGGNQYGELGIGDSNLNINQLSPVQIDSTTNWESVVSGRFNVFAFKTDRTVRAWGYDAFGQMGDGTTNANKTTPILIACNPALPIILSSFTVQKNKNAALLTWQTAMEQNSKLYQLERSKDGMVFHPIASIISNNYTGGSTYTYTDAMPFNGRNYYRLKSIDVNGNFTYSNIKTINFEINANELSLFPNPVKNTLSVISNFKCDKLSVTITDLAGRRLISRSISNNNPVSISLSDIKAGIYIVTISDGTNVEKRKIIKD